MLPNFLPSTNRSLSHSLAPPSSVRYPALYPPKFPHSISKPFDPFKSPTACCKRPLKADAHRTHRLPIISFPAQRSQEMLMTRGASHAALSVYASVPSRLPALSRRQRLFSTLLLPSSRLFCSSRHLGGALRRFGRRGSAMDGKSGVRAAAPRLENVDELIDSVETFLFDCDGVIWKGDKLIDGVPETLDMLRSKGKRLVFVTNNSTKSRKQYGKKFETLGLSVTEEEIFASSFAAAAYLKSIDFPKHKKVYVIGEDGILKELELAGFQYLGGPKDGDKKIELKPGFYMEHDENVGAVVVGFDRYFNYYKVQYGTLCIRENPGCLFIATNRDAVTHLTDAQEWAGGGSMVGAICGSTQQQPLVVGKPSTFMMEYLSNKFGISKSQICMVGDRLDTDILFGQNGGCKTLLVLSGVTTLQMLQSPNNSIQPDFFTNKISDLITLKAAAV